MLRLRLLLLLHALTLPYALVHTQAPSTQAAAPQAAVAEPKVGRKRLLRHGISCTGRAGSSAPVQYPPGAVLTVSTAKPLTAFPFSFLAQCVQAAAASAAGAPVSCSQGRSNVLMSCMA